MSADVDVDPTPGQEASPTARGPQETNARQLSVLGQTNSAQASSALVLTDAQSQSPDSQSPVSARQLRDKYNRLFEMAESAPEGPLSESPHEHGIIDSFLSAHEQSPLQQQGLVQPQADNSAGPVSNSHAQGGAANPRADAHLSLTEMLLLEEDSLAESKATPLLQHRVSMASNLADAYPPSPSSSASPFTVEKSIFASADHSRGADSASTQQAESSGGGGGVWPGPAPEWISVVMRGKHGGNREAFIQYHVPEALVYVNGTNLSLKV